VSSADDVVLDADLDRLVQVLTNLVGNAIKHSPPGESVVTTATVSSDRVRFRVADRGPGIPPEARAGLFQRFHQLDATDGRAKGGTGLGLAIARSIVELHGGAIGVEDGGPGATFWFELPMNARA
jgi:signal transduction histidine kinase